MVGEEEEGVGVDVEEEEIIDRLRPCLMRQMRNFVLDMRSVREIVTGENEVLDVRQNI